jgi:hypothetical protein
MMAWGADSSAWDDSVDRANLAVFNYGEIPDARFVMTTWHDDEPLSETFWFAEHAAWHPVVPLDETVIVHVGASAREAVLLQAYEDAQEQPE